MYWFGLSVSFCILLDGTRCIVPRGQRSGCLSDGKEVYQRSSVAFFFLLEGLFKHSDTCDECHLILVMHSLHLL